MCDIPAVLREHYDDPYHRGPAEHPTHAADAHCVETGCLVHLDLTLGDDGRLLEIWFDGQGCAVCEGLCSLMAERLEGRVASECARFDVPRLQSELGVEESCLTSACRSLPHRALQAAWANCLVQLDEDLADGSHFGGPSLREEC